MASERNEDFNPTLTSCILLTQPETSRFPQSAASIKKVKKKLFSRRNKTEYATISDVVEKLGQNFAGNLHLHFYNI